MVNLEKAVIAKIEKFGMSFELLVDPVLAMDMKHGKKAELMELLAVETIFKDAKTGDEQSPESVLKAFQTNDLQEVTEKIITHGEIQLTTEQRRQMLEKKRKEIIEFISRNAIDPQNKTPHPPQRIENAMEQAKIHIDPFKSNDEQIRTIVNTIKSIIPISMEKIDFAIKVDSDTAQFNIATAYPGTEFYKWAKESNLLLHDGWENFNVSDKVIELKTISNKKLDYYYSLAHKKYYLRPKVVLRRMKNLLSISGIKQEFDGLRAVLGV